MIHGEIEGRASFGRRTIRLRLGTAPERAPSPSRAHPEPVPSRLGTSPEPGSDALDAAIDAIGHMPLPPYIARPDAGGDRERYQTVYARERGSVAAPTAGLHFTPAILAAIDARGVERAAVTLHVGYGTFKPVRVEEVEAHVVDPEHYTIAPDVAARLNAARAEGRRVVAVGTTTVRALESAGRGGPIAAGDGTADVFLHPGGAPDRPRRRAAHQLPPAALVAPDAGVRLCRAGGGASRIS